MEAHRLGLHGVALEDRHPSGENRQRRIVADRLVAERRQPALHGGDLARLVRRKDQGGDQLDASVALGRVQQVLDRERRRPVRFVPVCCTDVQLREHIGFHSSELGEQELAEQAVVPIPLPPPIERDEERARRLESAQPVLHARLAEDRLAQRRAELIEHRGTTEKLLIVLGEACERLAYR